MLYRQLNVLAAQQLLLKEPQLCALVVRSDTGIPGEGFFWVLDVDPRYSEEDKRKAHGSEITRVYAHAW